MYEAFYGLTEKPFDLLPDPSYLYLGKRHSLAYTMLEYGVQHRAGFTVVTGEIGCGKTTLLRHLLNNLGDDVTVGLISNTQQEIGELLQWVLLSFGLSYEGGEKIALFDRLQQFLIGEYAQGRRTVLIVDEAQNLSAATLEELRMLSNINADRDRLLQLVLTGQPQLRALLTSPELEQFAQRVSVDYHIPPLEEDEVRHYVQHRLAVAGRDTPLFDDGALLVINRVSGGRPRKINVLCDTALVYGFAEQVETITGQLLIEVVKDKVKYGALTVPARTDGQVLQAAPSRRGGSAGPHDIDAARELFAGWYGKKTNKTPGGSS